MHFEFQCELWKQDGKFIPEGNINSYEYTEGIKFPLRVYSM